MPAEPARLTFPYPRGWYRIGDTAEFKNGELKTPRYFARHFRVHRNGAGELAAHGSDGITRPVLERGSRVLMYFDSMANEPTFTPSSTFASRFREWVDAGDLKWNVRSNIQEVSENSVDTAHFIFVHRYDVIPKIDGPHFDRHRMRVNLESYRKVLFVDTPVQIALEYEGLGLIVGTVHNRAVDLLVTYMPTPIDEERLELTMSLQFRRSSSRIKDAIIKALLPWEVARDFKHDIPIWENKKYHHRPVLCSADGPIVQLRRWAGQFYVNRS